MDVNFILIFLNSSRQKVAFERPPEDALMSHPSPPMLDNENHCEGLTGGYQ